VILFVREAGEKSSACDPRLEYPTCLILQCYPNLHSIVLVGKSKNLAVRVPNDAKLRRTDRPNVRGILKAVCRNGTSKYLGVLPLTASRVPLVSYYGAGIVKKSSAASGILWLIGKPGEKSVFRLWCAVLSVLKMGLATRPASLQNPGAQQRMLRGQIELQDIS
jgi:hypothetical protein